MTHARKASILLITFALLQMNVSFCGSTQLSPTSSQAARHITKTFRTTPEPIDNLVYFNPPSITYFMPAIPSDWTCTHAVTRNYTMENIKVCDYIELRNTNAYGAYHLAKQAGLPATKYIFLNTSGGNLCTTYYPSSFTQIKTIVTTGGAYTFFKDSGNFNPATSCVCAGDLVDAYIVNFAGWTNTTDYLGSNRSYSAPMKVTCEKWVKD